MAILISGGRDNMRTAMYGVMSNESINYIQNRINSLTERYGESAFEFQQAVQHRFDTGALRAINIAKNSLEFAGSIFEDSIRPLYTVDEFRYANPLNQSYLCAMPYINQEVRAGRLEGWCCEDRYPNLPGERNPLYQSVMSGVLLYGDEGEDTGGEEVFRIYMNEDLDNERELQTNEKLMIRYNWNRLYNLINGDNEEIDPTSISGAYL